MIEQNGHSILELGHIKFKHVGGTSKEVKILFFWEISVTGKILIVE